MTDYPIDEWKGCYPSAWKGKIVADAITHPAKFSSRLIRRIYDHMVSEGWLKAGDTVIDPFGGVALGALDAMRLGLRWRGIELEPRFADLGNQNIGLWNRLFRTMPGWCQDATLLQGDSRHLVEILKGDGSVSSPPYSSEALGHAGEPNEIDKKKRLFSRMAGNSYSGTVASPPYAESIGNAEKSGIDWSKQQDRDTDHPHGWNGESYSVVGSPPYANNGHEGGDTPTSEEHLKGGPLHLVGIDGVVSSSPYSEARVGQNSGQEHAGRGDQYGPTPGQLGAMKADGFDAALTSPPFRQATGGTPEPKPGGSIDAALYKRHAAGNSAAEGYGATDGQLANMQEGDFDATLASPPYSGSIPQDDRDFTYLQKHIEATQGRTMKRSADLMGSGTYGHTDGQLGSMKDGGHDAAVSSPPYEAQQVASIPGSGTDIELRKRLRASGEWEGYNRENTENLGNEAGDDFWMAARQIVEQVYTVLRPGAHAVWVVKGFVKDKQLVDFPGQWRQLCEAVGFVMVHEHRASLVHHKGTSHTLEGGTVDHVTESKSFFRRLAESKGSPRIDYETVLCMEKPA